MATHCSLLAWRIQWTEEPGGLQSMDFQRVRHNWVTEHTHMLGKNLGGGAQALQNFCYCLVVKSCPTLFDPMECSPLQAPLFMDFPGKNARVGFHFLLQGIFLTQGSNPCLLYWQENSLPLSHQRSLKLGQRWDLNSHLQRDWSLNPAS